MICFVLLFFLEVNKLRILCEIKFFLLNNINIKSKKMIRAKRTQLKLSGGMRVVLRWAASAFAAVSWVSANQAWSSSYRSL